MKDDTKDNGVFDKHTSGGLVSQLPGPTTLQEVVAPQSSVPVNVTDSSTSRDFTAISDRVTTSSQKVPNAVSVDSVGRAKPSSKIHILCHPNGYERVCHPCILRGGESECYGCDEDLPKLRILESLIPRPQSSSHDSDQLVASREEAIVKSIKTSQVLFCPKAGELCHTCMIAHGWAKCSYCELDFSILATFCTPPEKADYPTNTSNKSDTTSSVPLEVQSREKLSVSHLVEYLSSDDLTLGDLPWTGDFDLAKARLDVLKADDSADFEVIHSVQTSIYNREDPQFLRLRQGLKSIMRNPRIQLKARTTSIRILSAEIINDLSKVVSYYPSMVIVGGELLLKEPYDIIAHHMRALESGQLGSCTKSFLNFIKQSFFGNRNQEEHERHEKGLCTFSMLWLLFKPGQTVYAEKDGDLLAFVVSSVESPVGILSSKQGSDATYYINVWNMQFDGRFVGRCAHKFAIERFEGERDITTLKVYPSRFIDMADNDTTRKRLEMLGRAWYQMLPGQLMHYCGMAKHLRGEKQHQLDGRVYVDNSAFYASEAGGKLVPSIGFIEDTGGPDHGIVPPFRRPPPDPQRPLPRPERSEQGIIPHPCTCASCHGMRPHPPPNFRWTLYDCLDPTSNSQKNLEDASSPEGPRHRYLLASRQVFGMVLKSREWKQLNVASCFPSKPSSATFDRLVMPSERKELIKALVHKFTTSTSSKIQVQPWGADFIEGKGEGKIFLLHGGPGVGKTYTAECIAEHTGRPLLSLTSGDIGTDEVEMEKKLSTWFQLAERWGAVMLIDEADVYLEQRHTTDLKRNSLVSVFLRCIEYYRGILFLTTNRVGSFDDAFVSRIHVVIKYENLGSEERRLIWEQFFNKLEEEREDFVVASRAKEFVLEDEVISKVVWNGREIRNIFQTAVALAEYRFSQDPVKSGPTLEKKDFEQVCQMTRQFKQYLDSVHGANEDDRAALYRNRAALWDSSTVRRGPQTDSEDSHVYKPKPRS